MCYFLPKRLFLYPRCRRDLDLQQVCAPIKHVIFFLGCRRDLDLQQAEGHQVGRRYLFVQTVADREARKRKRKGEQEKMIVSLL